MAKVWQREWTTAKGEQRSAWCADYFSPDPDDRDGKLKRHIRHFTRKKDATDYLLTVRSEVRQGVHTPPNASITVAQAARVWRDHVRNEGREASTLAQYRQHVDKHIVPRIGQLKLATLTTPRVQQFRDDLLKDVSRVLAKKVLQSLKSLIKDAQRRGSVAQNVAAVVAIGIDKRGKRKLEVGVDIPTREEIRSIIDAAPAGRPLALLWVAAFAGLRASELRGLRWGDVNLKDGKIRVTQRADRYNVIGPPKSTAGERTIPIGPMVIQVLREWKLQCPKGEQLGLVFPNAAGRIEHHKNMSARDLGRAEIAAGVIDKDGKPKYGMHSMRHFYASWCINRRAAGGLELPIKDVQTRLGHASITMTSDVYGHMFPTHDDGTELAAAEQAIFAT